MTRLPPWLAVIFPLGIALGQWSFINSSQYPLLDEGQMIVQARMFLSGHLPWAGVDTTTSGPLNSLWPLWSLLVGSQPTFFTTRLISALTLGGTCCVLFFAWRRHFNPTTAWLLSLPIWLLLCLQREPVLQTYHSGVVPSLLFALAFWAWTARRYTLATALGGWMLWSKIQAVPIAWVVSTGLLQRHFNKRTVFLWAAPVFFLILLAGLGSSIRHLFVSYFLMALDYNLAYVIPPWIKVMPTLSPWLMLQAPAWVLCAIFNLVGILLSPWMIPRELKTVWPFLLAGIAGCGVLWLKGIYFLHYHGLIVVPLFIAGGLVWGRARKGILLLFTGILLAVLILSARPPLGPDLRAAEVFGRSIVKAGVTGELFIWGWSPELYLTTKTLPATRDSIAQMAMFPGRYQTYYVERVLSDLRASQPRWILDSTCWYPQYAKRCGQIQNVSLNSWLQEEYVQHAEIRGEDRPSLVLWRRK